MKVLYLSYDGMTDPLGQSQVIPYLEGLTAYGYEFSLVSFEKQERYEASGQAIRARLNEKGIAWYPLSYTKYPPVLSTVYDVFRLWFLVRKLHSESGFKLIHCRSYITSIIGERLARKAGIGWIFDMRGFWADERVEGNLWNISNPIFRLVYRYFKRKEHLFLRRASATVCLTHKAKKIMLQDFKPAIENLVDKLFVIPCCVDTALFSQDTVLPSVRNQLIEKFELSNKFPVVSYLGSIGTWYMLDEMLLFFAALLKKYPNAHLLMITPDKPEHILSRALDFKISSQNLSISYAARNEVPTYLSLSSFSIFFIKPSFSKQASSPTKQGELMSMGIPILCNAGIGDSDEVVTKYNSGALIDLSVDKAVENAVDLVPELMNKDTSAIVKGAHAYFSLEAGVNTYLSVYQKVANHD